jgi:putative transcriptional regulator
MNRFSCLRGAFALLLATALSFTASLARADEAAAQPASNTPDAVVLVATPQLDDSVLGSSVVLVMPLQSGGHAGFILNKPTRMTLGQAFPDDGPSQKVQDPVYLGGPINPNIIFALVKRPDSPGQGAVQFTRNLYLAVAGETVDSIIQNEADHARFFAGAMIWGPGELKQQVDQGAWYVRSADADLALSKNSNLWQDLVSDSERKTNTF